MALSNSQRLAVEHFHRSTGVAKLMHRSWASDPRVREPPQIRGEPIGTGSDIYSLGVLLYELVTGIRPYRIDDARPSAIEHVICHVEPPRPSTHATLRHAGGNVRDLDAIILKALEKTARRRYVSCAAFAEDLRHWLDGEPVGARNPTVVERTQRFVRRHRFGASVAATASITLLLGTAAALWQAREAMLARDRAERINGFLQDMLGAADHGNLGRDAKLGDVLDTARRNAELVLNDDPATLGATELTLAKAYRHRSAIWTMRCKATTWRWRSARYRSCRRWRSTRKSRCQCADQSRRIRRGRENAYAGAK